MSKFAIATFAYSERYQKQVNRMISEIDSCDFKPTVVVVTDNVDNILDKPFVKKYDILQFNPEYKNYSDSYYTFDFSVKRYSLLAALNLGFTKIILSDADAVPNKSLFTEEYIMKGFASNSIQGQVTYNFSKEIMTNSELGKRFLSYEKYFNVVYDKNQLNFMPEDCIQFVDIEMPKFYNFLRVWDECIKYKNSEKLSNAPAGNIDEMCFAALHCGLTVGNNSDKSMNALTPIHDKWYDSAFSTQPIEVKKNKTKKVVTSVYEINYIDERGGSFYKSFHLLTQTIRGIIFDDYEYVIYTDKFTYDKHNLESIFPQKNVTIKFKELNSDYYNDYLNPIREKRVSDGEIWDRIHCVKNYIEVIYNKIEFLLSESLNNDSDIIWIDSGMFGTSCSNGWRDKMNEICHTKNFLNKIFEKINSNNFIAMKGNHILMNYEVREKIYNSFGVSPLIVPACLFGGNSNLVIEYLSNYKEVVDKLVSILNDYTSEQEILFLMLHDKPVKFFDFDDWDDLQKGVLKIMDLYNELTYDKDKIVSKEIQTLESTEISSEEEFFGDFTKIADFFGIDKGSLHEAHMYTETYQKYMNPYIELEPTIVEIGINDSRFPGGCLYFWDKVFPKMKYYGFDITNCENLNFNKEKISVFQGDQNNEKDLENFISYFNLSNKIDFIIDDGSHVHEHIITSFKNLFPHLKNGGVYFIEDLHAGWAKREETLKKIKEYLENNFDGKFHLNENDYKLLIIEKKLPMLDQKYNSLLLGPGDIHEHLPTLKKYSEYCNHVTEMGVNFAVSTYAFMMGKPKKLISYDIVPIESFGIDRNTLVDLAKENGTEFSFIVADTTKIEIEDTDLLFIDTEHNYLQLKTELILHSKRVKKYIIFHDTVTYGYRDSNFYGHYTNLSEIDEGDSTKQGLMFAINEFLEKNSKWEITEIFENCNGLIVLKNVTSN